MKRLLLVLTSTFPRWQQDTDPPFVLDLCKRLLNKYDIHVLCPHASGAETAELYNGISVARFRYFFEKLQTLAYQGGILNKLREKRWRYILVPFFLIAEILATARLLRRQRFVVINAHWLIPQGFAAICAKKLTGSAVPIICTLHGGDIFSLDMPVLKAVKRFVLSQTSAVVVVSQAMRTKVLTLGVEHSRIHVIPMGVDLKTTFIPSKITRQQKSLLFVGRLVEKKGLRYLIEAMPMIVKKHPEACLTVVGHGPEEPAIMQLINSLRLNDAVTMLGALENSRLPAVYQSAEIVVFPSIVDAQGDTEGFGLVAVEALGCECAVVASDLPPVHDIIVNGKTGLFVEQKNAQQIAAQVIYLLDNPACRKTLAADGRQYVLQRYDWDLTAKKYNDLFESLL